MIFKTCELPLSERKFLHSNFKKIVEKMNVVTFSAHPSVTIKRLTRYKQKVVLAAMLEGKSTPSNMEYKSYYFAEKSNCHKMRFLSNFGYKIIFMPFVNIWHQRDSNSLFKGRIDHVTSSCKWPIECFHSRGQHLCKFIGTKEIVYIRKEFNSHRTSLGHQHGRRFIVLGHQYGRRDVM